MSSLIMGLVWEMPITKTFNSKAKFIALAYADHAWQDGTHAYPSIELVSRKTGFYERTVQRYVQKLVEIGLFIPDGKGPRGTNQFSFPLVQTDGTAKLEMRPVGGVSVTGVSNEASEGCQRDGGVSVTGCQRDGGVSVTGVSPVTPESLTPESLTPELKVVLKNLREGEEKKQFSPDFSKFTVSEARKWPTIRLYIDATEFFPGSILWGYVDSFITEHQLSEAKIKAAAIEWMVRGYKQSNVKGILEWAAFGIPLAGKSSEPVRPPSQIFRAEEHPDPPGVTKMPDSVRERLGKLTKKLSTKVNLNG
jgi:hypothetical protein